jgi:outer membrane biosynthesis protein TonB
MSNQRLFLSVSALFLFAGSLLGQQVHPYTPAPVQVHIPPPVKIEPITPLPVPSSAPPVTAPLATPVNPVHSVEEPSSPRSEPSPEEPRPTIVEPQAPASGSDCKTNPTGCKKGEGHGGDSGSPDSPQRPKADEHGSAMPFIVALCLGILALVVYSNRKR